MSYALTEYEQKCAKIQQKNRAMFLALGIQAAASQVANAGATSIAKSPVSEEGLRRRQEKRLSNARSSASAPAPRTSGRGLHSYPIQLNSSSSVHRVTRPYLAHKGVLELLKLSSTINECKPLTSGRLAQQPAVVYADDSLPDDLRQPRGGRGRTRRPLLSLPCLFAHSVPVKSTRAHTPASSSVASHAYIHRV